jgi:hypothetical protein
MSKTRLDPDNKRLQKFLAGLTPHHELVVRIAMRGRYNNLGQGWYARIDELETRLKINTTAKMAKLMREVRGADAVIDKWEKGERAD